MSEDDRRIIVVRIYSHRHERRAKLPARRPAHIALLFSVMLMVAPRALGARLPVIATSDPPAQSSGPDQTPTSVETPTSAQSPLPARAAPSVPIPPGTAPSPPSRAEQQRERKLAVADICEAVFRYQMDHNPARQYFLWFDNRLVGKDRVPGSEMVATRRGDPTNAFLRRFAGNRPPVRKNSDGMAGKDENGFDGIIDRKTHTSGLLVWVSDLTWIDDDTVEVNSGEMFASLDGGSGSFRAVRSGMHWAVTQYHARAFY